MKQIVIVEDDLALSHGISLALKNEEVQFIECHTLEKARAALNTQKIDLVILDINLPDGNGLSLLQEIKKSKQIPVICLTANDLETDIVMGFELGADDYVTKPFSLMVLRARVNNQLKRYEPVKAESFWIDDFYFDFEHMVFKKKNELVELSKSEQKLLRLLVTHRGQIMTREQLIDNVWTDAAEYVDENALSVTIKRLRGKLEADPSKPDYIKTVYGKGYLWVVAENE